MGTKEIYDLLKRYREHQCTPEEEEQVMRWYDQFNDDVENLPEIPEGKLAQLWYFIHRRISNITQKRRVLVFSRYAAVIAILFIVGAGVFYFNETRKQEQPGLANLDILPARGIAVLRLSDGREVPLDKVFVIRDKEGAMIKNDSLQILDYTLAEKRSELLYNTITVPAGGEYRVLLSDGSSVRLNSCSALTYPVAFAGDVREVKLTGEAYFDVAKSDKPFIVNTANIDVRVLGTSFNLSDYTADHEASVTLVAGKVSVRGRDEQKEFNITPGMRFEYNKENKQVKLEEVDPELYISWMLGIFKFEDMRLEDIMVKLNRWYDCSVAYKDSTLQNLRFTGAAEKDRSASYLLELIETITDVKFEINGKNILVEHK